VNNHEWNFILLGHSGMLMRTFRLKSRTKDLAFKAASRIKNSDFILADTQRPRTKCNDIKDETMVAWLSLAADDLRMLKHH